MACGLAGALGVSLPSDATALQLIDQNPKVDELVDGNAVAFALRFDGPVDHENASMTLITPEGERPLGVRLETAPDVLYGAIGRLAPGHYQLRWQARAVDGATLSGVFPFRVRAP
jgi:methionine-rich copper-binding protein CopC